MYILSRRFTISLKIIISGRKREIAVATAHVYTGNGRFVVLGTQPGKQTGKTFDYSDAWILG